MAVKPFRRIPGKQMAAGSKDQKSMIAFDFFVFAGYIISQRFFAKSGEMAERSKAAVSKTVNGIFPFGGSNPPLSAIFTLRWQSLRCGSALSFA